MSIPTLERKRFMVGRYEIIAHPIRVGLQFLENPPPVPPLKIFRVTHRPG